MNSLLRECIAELVGTFILILFGDGVVANITLLPGAGVSTHINICWGLAVTLGVLHSGGISGGHLNPAVTTTMALFKGFPLIKVVPYILSQFIGAFLGACAVYITFMDTIEFVHNPDNPETVRQVNGVFHTFPGSEVSAFGAVWSEVIGTAALLSGILAIGDKKNVGDLGKAGPWAVGALVIAIGMALGNNTGYAINPARDFGPRMLCLMVFGSGGGAFGQSGNDIFDMYWPIPLFCPIIGGAIGAAFYKFSIEIWHPKDDENEVFNSTTDMDSK